MKNIIGCLMFLAIALMAHSQQVYFEAGKINSSFDYKDSEGNKIGNLQGSNQNSLCVGYRNFIVKPNFNFFGSVSYVKYGAKGSDKTLGNSFDWEMEYVGVNLGIDYEFFRPSILKNEQHGFSFCIIGSVASEFLLKGTQTVNGQVNDLKGLEEFDKPFYFARGGVSLNYYISKSFVLYGKYMGGTSFLIGDYKNQEQLRLITHNVSIGLSISLVYDN